MKPTDVAFHQSSGRHVGLTRISKGRAHRASSGDLQWKSWLRSVDNGAHVGDATGDFSGWDTCWPHTTFLAERDARVSVFSAGMMADGDRAGPLVFSQVKTQSGQAKAAGPTPFQRSV